MGLCNCSMFVVRSYFVSILVFDGEERAGCFFLSSWLLVIVVWLFLVVPRVCLRFVIVVFPDHTHYFSVSKMAAVYHRSC